MTVSLRRLAQDSRPLDQVLLVTDERLPFNPATAGQDYLEQIRLRYGERFRHRELTFDHYAELEALQVIVGQARSGDLEVEMPSPDTRRPKPMIASACRQSRFLTHPPAPPGAELRPVSAASTVPALRRTRSRQNPAAPQDTERDVPEPMGRSSAVGVSSKKGWATLYRHAPRPATTAAAGAGDVSSPRGRGSMAYARRGIGQRDAERQLPLPAGMK